MVWIYLVTNDGNNGTWDFVDSLLRVHIWNIYDQTAKDELGVSLLKENQLFHTQAFWYLWFYAVLKKKTNYHLWFWKNWERDLKMFVDCSRVQRVRDKPTYSVDDIDIQSVIDSWRWRCRKACKFLAVFKQQQHCFLTVGQQDLSDKCSIVYFYVQCCFPFLFVLNLGFR